MRTPRILLFLLTLLTSIHALAIPTSFSEASQLFKRKGGGGGGGRGGSSSSSSSSSSSGSSSSGGSRGSGSSSGGRSGGVAGVGPQPRGYGGGSYYGGGSARPYPAGQSRGGVNPRLLPLAGVGFLGAGALAYGYYMYPYAGSWYYHNRTSNENETHPVQCYCGRYNHCACEQRNETDYVDDVANNQTISRVADVNGTDTLLINGTLPNGTVVEEAGESLANTLSSGLGQFGGWAVIGGAVAWGVWFV